MNDPPALQALPAFYVHKMKEIVVLQALPQLFCIQTIKKTAALQALPTCYIKKMKEDAALQALPTYLNKRK